jgi:hypothetical protein
MGDDDERYISEPFPDDVPPTEDEVRQCCELIGLDPDGDPDLPWIARAGVHARLPPGWKCYRNERQPNQYFFFNKDRGESLYDHPLDQQFRNQLAQE